MNATAVSAAGGSEAGEAAPIREGEDGVCAETEMTNQPVQRTDRITCYGGGGAGSADWLGGACASRRAMGLKSPERGGGQVDASCATRRRRPFFLLVYCC